MRSFVAAGIAVALALAWAGAVEAQAWRPEKNVEIIAPANPGGAHDVTARSLQRVFQANKLVDVPVVVLNKGGGGGTLGWTHVSQQAGDAHVLSITAVNLLTNHIMGVSALNYTDFTTLAQLFNEYLVLAVKADSPVTSGKDAIVRLGKDPRALSVAIGTSLGNTGHLALALAVRPTGADIRKLRTVVFGSNGEAMTALLGGHVDAMMTSLSNVMRHAQTGAVRVLAVSSPQRVADFAGVPTWREQGIDVLMSGWRGVVGPKGLAPGQIAYWERVFEGLARSEDWKQELAKQHWYGSQLSARESREFLDRQYAEFQQVLTDLGMAKAKPAK